MSLNKNHTHKDRLNKALTNKLHRKCHIKLNCKGEVEAKPDFGGQYNM